MKIENVRKGKNNRETNAYRLEGHVVDGEDVKVCHVVHDIAEQVAPFVRQRHPLDEVLEGVEGVDVELCVPPGVLVHGEVSAALVHSVLVRSETSLVDLQIK